MFNRGTDTNEVTLSWTDAGLSGKQTVHDVWLHKDVGDFEDKFTQAVPSHGSVLLRVQAK